MEDNASFYEKKADSGEYFNFHSARANVMPAHFHNNMEIIFVQQGTICVGINGVERVEKAGDIAVSNSFDVHYYRGSSDSLIFVLVFSGSYLKGESLDNTAFDNFLTPCADTPLLFDALKLFSTQVKPDDKYLRSALVNFVVGLLARNYGTRPVGRKDSGGFREILGYIQQNIKEDLTSDSLAKHFGYTKNYFSTLFNQFTGMHFRDYLNRIRLEKIADLIEKNPSMSITEAALDCGYKSLNTYYRALHKAQEEAKQDKRLTLKPNY